MTKRIITCLISLMLSITSSVAIFANENVNELTIDESNGYTTKLCYDDDTAISVNTYKDGELIFSSYAKSDGNIYMLIDGKEVLAVEISYEQQNSLSLANYSIRRAPSTFILTSSGALQNIKITGSVIEAGKAAIRNALWGAMAGAIAGGGDLVHGALVGASSSALTSLVDYIWTHYETYDTSITRNTYVYNGCTWLTYTEFVYPEGYTIGMYNWTDNPSLGVAPYTCKIASQTYPY